MKPILTREGIELVSRSGQWLLGSVALAVLAVSIWRGLQLVAIAAFAAFILAALPRVLEDLVKRLEELGPAKFRQSRTGIRRLPASKKSSVKTD